jgi:ribonuclease HII
VVGDIGIIACAIIAAMIAPASLEKESKSACRAPTLNWETRLWISGAPSVAGLDEVGRGPLAGPLFAGAVILRPSFSAPWLDRVRDSKLLRAAERENLDTLIRADAVAVAVGISSTAEVDRLGVVAATTRAMRRALARLGCRPNHLLVDAFPIPRMGIPQTPIIHGDRLCVSIACASIVAKVARDRAMVGIDARFPGYGFAQNKGYGTPAHLQALRLLGPSRMHRRSFAPVRLLDRADWTGDAAAVG